jgi:hypothetical protein
VGGLNVDKNSTLSSVFRLDSADGTWQEMPNKLSKPRVGHTAFFGPNIANCRKK